MNQTTQLMCFALITCLCHPNQFTHLTCFVANNIFMSPRLLNNMYVFSSVVVNIFGFEITSNSHRLDKWFQAYNVQNTSMSGTCLHAYLWLSWGYPVTLSNGGDLWSHRGWGSSLTTRQVLHDFFVFIRVASTTQFHLVCPALCSLENSTFITLAVSSAGHLLSETQGLSWGHKLGAHTHTTQTLILVVTLRLLGH